ncbi:MAG: hypothetical protein HZA78_11195 [Candidatus Schekmanbacteria bacterium]|nr:hypothetical protein [Candidatus Schekmanbacteria bacterium]
MLKNFREFVVLYFDNSKAHWMVQHRIENDKAKEVRTEINQILKIIHSIINMANINTMTIHIPSASIGGLVPNIDVILNIFNLQGYQIKDQHILDYIDRAIGVYKTDFTSSIFRTINPFYWLGLILDFIVSLPFILIGKDGFDPKKVEASFLGKLLKFGFYLIGAFASFLTILHFTGYLDSFKKTMSLLIIKR